MEVPSHNAFKIIFPRYSDLLSTGSLHTSVDVENFVRNQLPDKIQMVRKMEITFAAFLTQYTNLILKRPQQNNLVHSLLLKATQRTDKYFQNLQLKTNKLDKNQIEVDFQKMNFPELRNAFREKLRNMSDQLQEKFFVNFSMERECEEEATIRLYNLFQIYHFTKCDLITASSRYRISENIFLQTINSRQQIGDISQLINLDSAFINSIHQTVNKRCRPFINKRDFLQNKTRQILKESQSKVGQNFHIFLDSLVTKEKYRVNKEITSMLQKQLRSISQKTEEQLECKQIIGEVEVVKKQFNKIKNNSYFIDIMRGNFVDKYKMELNKLDNLYYLSNLEKYLQDVAEFLEKLLRLEEKIINNRKNYMKKFAHLVQTKINELIVYYGEKNESRRDLWELIEDQFQLLESSLYGVVKKPMSEKSSSTQQEERKRKKVQQAEERKQKYEVERQERQRKRQQELQIKREEQKRRKQEEKIKMEERKRQQGERMQKLKKERQEKQRQRRQEQQMLQEKKKQQMSKKQQQRKRRQLEQKERRDAEMKKKQEERKKLEEAERQKKEKLKRQKQERERIQREETEKKKAEQEQKRRKEREELQRKKDEQEKRKKKEEQDRKQRQQEEKKRKEEQRQRKLKEQEEKKRKLQEEKLEKEKKQKMEKERKLQEERLRKQQQKMKQQKRKQQKRIQQEQQKRRKEEAERKRLEEKKKQQQLERQKKEQLERKKKEEQLERKRKEEQLQRKRKEQLLEKKRKQEELEKKRKEEQQRKRIEAEEKKRKQEELRRKKQEEEKRLKLEEEKRARQEKEKKQLEIKLQKEKQEKQKKQKQAALKKKKEEQAKNIKKNGSGINYAALDELMSDEQPNTNNVNQKPAQKGKKEKVDDQYNLDLDYADDFEDQSPSKEEQQIQTKQLIGFQNFKCINDYVKGTQYARKNKLNLEPFNNYNQYVYIFEELIQNKKIFVFQSSISKGILDFSLELLDENNSQEDLRVTLQTIREAIYEAYEKDLEQKEFDPRTQLVFPFSFPNNLAIQIIQVLPAYHTFHIVLNTELSEDDEVRQKYSSLIEAFLHVFEIEGEPRIIDCILPQESKMVIDTFDKQIPNLLILFAMHYEHTFQNRIQINQYTVDRFFYSSQILQPFYQLIEEQNQTLNGFYDELAEKYSHNEKVSIQLIQVETSDENYEAIITDQSAKLKEHFLESNMNTLLVLFQVIIQEEESMEKIIMYAEMTKGKGKPTLNYYIVSKDDIGQENASQVFEMIAGDEDDKFQASVYIDYTRHNGPYEYSDWTLPLWAHMTVKRKMTPINAIRAIVMSMAPYYIAFKQMD